MTSMPQDQFGFPIQVGRLNGPKHVITTATNEAKGTVATVGGVNGTKLVRLCATTDCYFDVGVNPTATISDNFLPSGVVEYIAVEPGDIISALAKDTAGALHVTECGDE